MKSARLILEKELHVVLPGRALGVGKLRKVKEHLLDVDADGLRSVLLDGADDRALRLLPIEVRLILKLKIRSQLLGLYPRQNSGASL